MKTSIFGLAAGLTLFVTITSAPLVVAETSPEKKPETKEVLQPAKAASAPTLTLVIKDVSQAPF
jgi:hypothetical protein